jgi:cytochrome c biogenesis protein CcdA
VKPLLSALATQYPDLDIRMLEIYHNATNQATFSAMRQQYGIGDTGIPVIFIGKQVLIGDINIKDHLEEVFLEEKRSSAACTNATGIPSTPPVPCPPTPAILTPGLVIGSALVDSVNPCAFSVLIFLLVSVVSLRNRRRILAVGGCYIAAVFCFYLLSGLGLLTLVRISGVSLILAYLGAGVAIVLGLVSVIDVWRNKDDFLLAIPESKKEQINHYIQHATLPAAFMLGILVGIFELPCTGGIYLAILGLVSTNYTLAEGLPYLILYNLIFVLPLVVILLLVAFGLDPERADAWRIRHRRVLRLIVGVAMILLGVVIFAGIVG